MVGEPGLWQDLPRRPAGWPYQSALTLAVCESFCLPRPQPENGQTDTCVCLVGAKWRLRVRVVSFVRL